MSGKTRRLAISAAVAAAGLLGGWTSVEVGVSLYTTSILFVAGVLAVAVAIRPVWLLVVLAIPSIVAMGCASSWVANSLRLSAFSSQLREHLPPESEIVMLDEHVSVFLGMGNHCDYFAQAQIQTPLSLQEVRRHYAQVSLVPAIPGGDGVQPRISVSEIEPRRYDIVLVDGPYSRNLDLRCT